MRSDVRLAILPSMSVGLYIDSPVEASPTDECCDVCGAVMQGEPAGHGLLVFPRGDAVSYEEPPLCAQCAHAIGMTALWRWAEEEEGG